MPTVKNYQDREKYIAFAKKVETQMGIPENLLVGVLGTESGFSEDVITGKRLSSAGAIGIAQFMPKTAKEYGIDPLDPYASIEAAGKYLSKSYKTLGNWDDSLRSYNMGVQGVKNVKSGKWKLPKETAEYVGKVYKKGQEYGGGVVAVDRGGDSEPTNTLTNFEPMGQMRNFASVPDLKEEPKEQVVAETESTQKLKEQAFLEDYNRLIAQPQQQVAQQEEEVIPLMQDNTEEIFNDTSQFIDEGFAQEGGIIVKQRNGVRNNPDGTESTHLMRREYVPNKGWIAFPSLFQNEDNSWEDSGEKYGDKWESIYKEAVNRGEVYEFGEDEQKAIDFADKGNWKNPTQQQGGIIDDNEGQLKYPGEVTRINSPHITMKNVPYPVLGVANTGETKMMYPNFNYTFKGENTVVTEYPQLTAKEKQFLKALKNDRTRIHN